MSKKKILTGIFAGILIIGIAFGAIGLANAHNGGAKPEGARAGYRSFAGNGFRQEGVNELADFLGISQSQLIEERKSGKTILEIAEAHGKTEEQLKNFLINETDSKLQGLLKEGKITQEQYQNMKTRVLERINEMINGKTHGMFGMHRKGMGNANPKRCGNGEGNMHRGFGRGMTP